MQGVSPSTAMQYGRARCIPFYSQQYGRAGCIPFYSQQYGRAGCMSFNTSSMDVQGVSLFTTRSKDMQVVSPSTANSIDLQGVYPRPAVCTTSSVNVQGVSQSFACCVYMRTAECMHLFFKILECWTVRYWNKGTSPVPECSGTGLRYQKPECRCRRHRP